MKKGMQKLLFHEDSVCTAMISSSSVDSSMAFEVHKIDPFHALLPSSAIWLIRECLKVLETCLGDDEGISKFLCKSFAPNGKNILGSKMSWPKRELLKVETGKSVSTGLASSSRDPSIGLSPLCGDMQTNLSLDNVGGLKREVQTNITDDASGVHILGLCDWPDFQYDVSSQAISVHLPLQRLLSLLIEKALRICNGKSTLHHGVSVIDEIPHADFFSSVIGDFHPYGFLHFLWTMFFGLGCFVPRLSLGCGRRMGILH